MNDPAATDAAAATAYLTIHGHAYQPPRESPRTGEVEAQPSAAPFHDWNQRIAAECYEAVASAAEFDDAGAVVGRVNLWGALSFDLGPTLGVWLDRHRPEVAAAVAEGAAAGHGHGAMGHPGVHAILPLAAAEDRRVMLRWGLADYEARFGGRARSMWLPETAVDTPSLEALVDEGIEWTLLAPHQVRRIGPDGSDLEPLHHPLAVTLPSGRGIVVVPYEGMVSHGIAFGGLLDDGARLADALLSSGSASVGELDGAPTGGDRVGDPSPALVVTAVDMETFGHHHRFGELAVARSLRLLQTHDQVAVIRPQEYLDRFGAPRQGRLVERTSWSCAHGVERWRSNCGCRFGDDQDQMWRRPLRDLLDAVADIVGREFTREAPRDLRDPSAARLDYGSVLTAHGAARDDATRGFLTRHLASDGDAERAIGWMELERLRLEAWSSCAWFFDSPDRIETRQSLDQAREALVRLHTLTSHDVTGWFDRQIGAGRLGSGESGPGDG
ncbi:MAG: DUF3536 domain-containing protein [Microthrixaceae bacterium]